MDWVLIRGIVSEKYHWGDFYSQVKKRFPDHLVETADILGNGTSRNKLSSLNISTQINNLRQQVSSKNKKILFGFSLGGMLALEWAYAHPDEVGALVLVNTSLHPSPFQKRLRPAALKTILQAGLKKDYLSREEMILKMTTAQLPLEKIKSTAEDWGQYGMRNPTKSINFFLQLALAAKIKQRPRPPAVPTLLLSSALDQVVHPDCSKKIAAIWNLKHECHEGAGHDLTLEDPEWVLNKVRNWLTEWRAKDQDEGSETEILRKSIRPLRRL